MECLYKTRGIARSSKKTATPRLTKTSTDLDPPGYWESMEDKRLKRVLMKPTDTMMLEYNRVSETFKRSLSNKTIVKIERLQNIDRWDQFAVKKRTMERMYGRGLADERLLFHGTKSDVVDRIVAQGIDFRLVERALYGDGAYFGSEAKISDYYTTPNTAGHRFMFMVRILVGKFTQGEKGWKKPPVVDQSEPDIHYDSAVDNPDNPKIFVIFDNSQCYPEYLIEYH